jgi:hypothetical protein
MPAGGRDPKPLKKINKNQKDSDIFQCFVSVKLISNMLLKHMQKEHMSKEKIRNFVYNLKTA